MLPFQNVTAKDSVVAATTYMYKCVEGLQHVFVMWYHQILRRRSLSPGLRLKSCQRERKNVVVGRKGGERKVTATAGLSWDAGQDVDSLFHFPSVFTLPTISCLHSPLLLLSALIYCIFYVFTCPCLTYLFSSLVFPLQNVNRAHPGSSSDSTAP